MLFARWGELLYCRSLFTCGGSGAAGGGAAASYAVGKADGFPRFSPEGAKNGAAALNVNDNHKKKNKIHFRVDKDRII